MLLPPDADADEAANAEGDRGGDETEDDHAETGVEDGAPGEQGDDRPEHEQPDHAEPDGDVHGGHARNEDEWRDRQNGSHSEQEERGDGGFPGGPTQFFGVHTQLFTGQSIQRGFFVR